MCIVHSLSHSRGTDFRLLTSNVSCLCFRLSSFDAAVDEFFSKIEDQKLKQVSLT